ncbi:MAG: ATP-binding protein [Saprospiraceae bacterium]|nr:ATP-binding protein [Saprospiraceae bacterium]
MKIVFTGPECSGKTTLANMIADKYQFGLVKETARVYLEDKSNRYDYHSLSEIANLQLREEKVINRTNTHLVCDTDLLTLIIWSQEKFDKTDPWIYDKWLKHLPGNYFLCAPDIPWEYDPQRENPSDRGRLFEVYQIMMDKHGINYTVVSGSKDDRMALVSGVLNTSIEDM